jgi:hypothetical protein
MSAKLTVFENFRRRSFDRESTEAAESQFQTSAQTIRIGTCVSSTSTVVLFHCVTGIQNNKTNMELSTPRPFVRRDDQISSPVSRWYSPTFADS